jgi:hypothetical protein
VISLKVVSIRLRHSAMTFSRLDGIAARCFLPGGTRTAVPRAACAAANALPLKPLSASRSRGAGPGYRWYRERDFAVVALSSVFPDGTPFQPNRRHVGVGALPGIVGRDPEQLW